MTAPRVRKGALVGLDPVFGLPTTVTVLQYNPAEMSRTVSAPQGGANAGSGAPSDNVPAESIRMKVELDAADQLERGDGMAQGTGIYPQLSSLELLVYRSGASILANIAASAAGLIEIVPASRPLAILVWGTLRILPVRLTQFSVRETAFDSHLNPIRAEIELSMSIVTYAELGWKHPGSWVYMANRAAREGLAAMSSVGAAGQLAN